jgi:hypothetical protein
MCGEESVRSVSLEMVLLVRWLVKPSAKQKHRCHITWGKYIAGFDPALWTEWRHETLPFYPERRLGAGTAGTRRSGGMLWPPLPVGASYHHHQHQHSHRRSTLYSSLQLLPSITYFTSLIPGQLLHRPTSHPPWPASTTTCERSIFSLTRTSTRKAAPRARRARTRIPVPVGAPVFHELLADQTLLSLIKLLLIGDSGGSTVPTVPTIPTVSTAFT